MLEICNCCILILGETSAALAGMWVTVVNGSTPDQLKTCVGTSSKIQNKVVPALIDKQVKVYEESNDNMCCSLKILYEKGLLAKEKYKSICRNIKITGHSIANPKLVYYDKLIGSIKSVDIDNVHDFASAFCKDILSEFEEQVSGAYRDFCSYVVILAKLYILVDLALGSVSFFQHFGN